MLNKQATVYKHQAVRGRAFMRYESLGVLTRIGMKMQFKRCNEMSWECIAFTLPLITDNDSPQGDAALPPVEVAADENVALQEKDGESNTGDVTTVHVYKASTSFFYRLCDEPEYYENIDLTKL